MNEDAKLFARQNSTRVTGQSLIKDLRVAAYTVPIDRRAKDNRIGFRDCLEHLIKLIIWKPLRELINLEFAEINFLLFFAFQQVPAHPGRGAIGMFTGIDKNDFAVEICQVVAFLKYTHIVSPLFKLDALIIR